MNQNRTIAIIAILALIAFFVPQIPSTTTVVNNTQPEAKLAQINPVEEPKELPKPQVPELYPTLKRICSCESTGKPYNEPQHYEADGVTVRYGRVNPRDTGMCQINLDYHQASAEAMGLDLFTPYGNATYANILFDQQGSTPWNWSRSCWE